MSDDEFLVARENIKSLDFPGESSSLAHESLGDRIAELRKQRGNLKRRLTLFDKYCDKLGEVLTEKERTELELRIQAFKNIYSNFNDIQATIELYSDESILDENIEYRERFEQLYFNVMAAAKCRLQGEGVNSSKCADNSIKFASVKLPDIKLPSFNGSYDQWLEFKNSYDTMIHKRIDLDPIQKFHYLRSALSGSALQVISALEFTATNYVHAWELLSDRFHNTRLLTQNHVKSLYSLQNILTESPVQIRKLIDTVNRNLRALKTIGEPVESWDTLIIYLIVTKLDSSTEREWENHKGSIRSGLHGNSTLKLDDLLTFLKNKADTLEMISASHQKQTQSRDNNNKSSNSNDFKKISFNKAHDVHSYVSTPYSSEKPIRVCAMCHKNHALYTCVMFLNMSVKERSMFVEKEKVCPNCLRLGHSVADCNFGPCRLCQKRHNGLLHASSDRNSVATHLSRAQSLSPSQQDESKDVGTSSATFYSQSEINSNEITCNSSVQVKMRDLRPVLLCTALVEIADSNDVYHQARALLDNGSMNCLISERFLKEIKLPYIQSTVRISGVGQSVSTSTQLCNLKMRSKLHNYSTQLECLVLPNITTKLPSVGIDLESVCIPENIQLADPTFYVPADIDLLLGADKFWELLKGETLRLPRGPYLQNSLLGWLISGKINNNNLREKDVFCYFNSSIDNEIDLQIKRFWELEEIPKSTLALTADERICEDSFCKTTKRDNDGRFIVQLPLKESPDSLGNSYSMALKRFFALERKLNKSPLYKKMYSDFIREYLDLGHMSRIESYSSPHYFLPHHGVFRESSETTKLRVVFDASALTTTHKSLNDIQYSGPVLQNDIFSILLRFRQYKFVACADCEKMYRQVLINEKHRDLQLIIWRENDSDSLCIYKLNTVTYGMTAAPYLSMRCLRELANCCDDPLVSQVINEDFYVDDLITGSDDIPYLLNICDKTFKVLRDGCFPLRKWTFNFNVTTNVSKELSIGEYVQSKTLGLGWLNSSDELHFTTQIEKTNGPLTKRIMLSIISQIYDPLGLLSPAVICLKIIIQKLWLCKIGWDDPVPESITESWYSFISMIDVLKEIRVPRFVRSENCEHTEVHMFSDASENAYGACAYVRTYSENSQVVVKLLCAKSKVSPLKAVTIPRLELCGALVGARLYSKIVQSLRLKFDRVYFWTDSTIVIGWLKTNPRMLKQFVQSRVTEINELTFNAVWLHINGKDNPADLLSRGVNLKLLSTCSLWWSGPSFLSKKRCIDVQTDVNFNENMNLPELKPQSVVMSCVESNSMYDFECYSSVSRMIRVSAYVERFISNIRYRLNRRNNKWPTQYLDTLTGPLSVQELALAERKLMTVAQRQMFPEEYFYFDGKLPTPLSKNNTLSRLDVFLDVNKILRVGGRLRNIQNFNFNKKHPILLCGKHRFTALLFRDEHKRLLHAGPQLLLSNLREKWWPLGGRNLARQTVRQCVTCARMKGTTLTPIMGNLPTARLHPGYPFMYCGVDYAGPMLVLNKKGRGSSVTKGYICLFVCFVTRAVHLELVSGLSSNDYILALKRFISRRGKPVEIHSDNGRNFVGAEKEIGIFLNKNSNPIDEYLSNENIKFRFIVPYSPHSGGLWESGVKSCKHHLRRVVGNSKLTFEEFSTVLTLIEAVLNSRPLTPLSTDPHDLNPLTPGHFLIGRTLTSPASQDLTEAAPHRLLRYDRIEQLRQHFWRRWSLEYVSELQIRTKWKSRTQDLEKDMMVLIKEDNLPPLKWKLGRILRTHPGKDGVSRIADVRTTDGVVQRSFAKICPLPLLHAQT